MYTKQSFAMKMTYWLKAVSLGLILGLGLQFAQAWTAPTQDPPGGNVSGPITTGSTGQIKAGNLAINTDGIYANALIVPNGNVGIGTITPSQKLSVNGNIETFGAGNGVVFPDGTKQTTAAGSGSIKILHGTGCGACPYGIINFGSGANAGSGCKGKDHLGNIPEFSAVLCSYTIQTGEGPSYVEAASWRLITY